MERNGIKNKAVVGRFNWHLGLALCIACFVALMVVHPVWAADFHVTTSKDGVDATIGDGKCVSNVVPGGACTLRAAIQESNFSAGPDNIFLPKGTFRLTIQNPQDISEDESATGDLDVLSNMVIEGVGPKETIIEVAHNLHDRVIEMIDEQAVLALRKVTIRNGDTTLLQSAISQDGGGIRNGGGTLEASDIAVISNTSPGNGGGLMTIGTTTASIDRCTVSGNKANGNNSQGGGIFVGQNHSLTLINCTISDNEANSRGGGIAISNNSHTTILLNTTVANNRLLDDPKDGGGVFIGNNNDVSILSSIIADNVAQNNAPNDCFGQMNLLDYSLIEHPAPSNGCRTVENNQSFFASSDPQLGPLADNGGELQTQALSKGSIAIDAGNPADPGSSESACAETDERGQARPSGKFCDMGAYEYVQTVDLFMPMLARP